MLEAAQDARRTVHDVTHAKGGRLTIGTVEGLPAFLELPALLAQFHDIYPLVEVRLIQGGTVHLLDELRAGLIDLALLPVIDPAEGIATTMIACEDLVVICAPSHPLVTSGTVTLATIGVFTFVDFQPDWGTRRLMDDAFRSVGIERKTAFEVSDLNTPFELVTRGLGIALVPESAARNYGPAVVCRPLNSPDV
ncbi:LysR substrate-binding domain-containing protein [Devosia riboflavina]|uniref:LysR substrate-binding domain-containing protein n=1 Tax=Devosia riboflavina TaxID=46914 RepID=UPI000A5639EF|nr:LysR substrate-binding domain-containing protein [Devosia riboflavina]